MIGAEFDQVHQRHAAVGPIRRAAGHEGFQISGNRFAHHRNDFFLGVEQCDGINIARLDERLEGGLQAVARHDAEPAQCVHDTAGRVGNVLGAVDQLVAGGLADAPVLEALPQNDKRPDCREQAVEVSSAQGHEFAGSVAGARLYFFFFLAGVTGSGAAVGTVSR